MIRRKLLVPGTESYENETGQYLPVTEAGWSILINYQLWLDQVRNIYVHPHL